MELNYIDIGCNLMGKQFKDDREQVVEQSMADGVGLIITGTDPSSNRAAADYVARSGRGQLWYTCGMHPHNADSWNRERREELVRLIVGEGARAVALGEAGLDYDRMFSTRENQIKCFSDILDLAEEHGLPLFLHERSAEGDFQKLMKAHRSLCGRSVVHCFTGTKETAYRYLQLGCMIGITGWVCDHRRNRDVVEALKIIPLERLMIETDAPYLTPLNVKGLSRRNVPSNIRYVADKIAEIKGVEPEEVRKRTLENTRAFFGL